MTYEGGSSLIHFGRSGTKAELNYDENQQVRPDRAQRKCQAVMLTAISLLPEFNEECDLVVVFRRRDCGGKDVQMQANQPALGLRR
jgi:hypothetical protein